MNTKELSLSRYRPSIFSNIDPRLKLFFVCLFYFFLFQNKDSISIFSEISQTFKPLIYHLILFSTVFILLILSKIKIKEFFIIINRLRFFFLLIILLNLIRILKIYFNEEGSNIIAVIYLSLIMIFIYSIKLVIMMMTSEWLLCTTPLEKLLMSLKSNKTDNNSLINLFILAIALLPVYLEEIEILFSGLKSNKKNKFKIAVNNLILLIKNIFDKSLDFNMIKSIDKPYQKIKWGLSDIIFVIFLFFFTLFWELIIKNI